MANATQRGSSSEHHIRSIVSEVLRLPNSDEDYQSMARPQPLWRWANRRATFASLQFQIKDAPAATTKQLKFLTMFYRTQALSDDKPKNATRTYLSSEVNSSACGSGNLSACYLK